MYREYMLFIRKPISPLKFYLSDNNYQNTIFWQAYLLKPCLGVTRYTHRLPCCKFQFFPKYSLAITEGIIPNETTCGSNRWMRLLIKHYSRLSK